MKKSRMIRLSQTFLDELVYNTLQFWTSHFVDKQYGGFTTYLDRRGSLLSTDKPMWAQCRTAWLFSRLFNVLEKRGEWIDLAKHGIDFIKQYGFDKDGRMFFLVTQDGRPLRKRRYLFTEIFGVIAFAEYSRASGDGSALTLARKTMDLVNKMDRDPSVLEPKTFPETRRTRSHSMSMIRINTYQVLRNVDQERDYTKLIDEAIDEVFTFFVKQEKRALLETVGIDGEYLDIPEGRCINPGHALETAWFILEEGKYRNDRKLLEKALPIVDWSLKRGWDEKYGGILYFVDVEGKQAEQLEWDMKLWWVHCEALYATLLAYHLTEDKRYERWFDKIYSWTFEHFRDRKYGEWYGYLHRDGSVALDCKGNIWKGPFHIPRFLLYSHLLLKVMIAQTNIA